MMRIAHPLLLIILGGLLSFFGFGVVFGMILRLWEAGFALSFLAYAASLIGMLLALLGVLEYNQRDRY
jgi:hypothetical protein